MHGEDGGVDGGSLADLHFIHGLLEDWTAGVRSRHHGHLHYGLTRAASAVCGLHNIKSVLRPGAVTTTLPYLHGDAVLFSGTQLACGLNHAQCRVNFELVAPVVGDVVNTV